MSNSPKWLLGDVKFNQIRSWDPRVSACMPRRVSRRLIKAIRNWSSFSPACLHPHRRYLLPGCPGARPQWPCGRRHPLATRQAESGEWHPPQLSGWFGQTRVVMPRWGNHPTQKRDCRMRTTTHRKLSGAGPEWQCWAQSEPWWWWGGTLCTNLAMTASTVALWRLEASGQL